MIFKASFFLQSAYSDYRYFRGHAQLRNSETTAILEGEEESVLFNQGIFIDIFPLDYSSKYQVINYCTCFILNNYLKVFRIMYSEDKSRFIVKRVLKKIIKNFFLHFDYIKMFHRFERTCMSIHFKSNYLNKISYFSKVSKYQNIPSEVYNESKLVEFEGVFVNALKDYDTVLRCSYGDDYMIPKQLSTCHGKVYYSVEINYQVMLRQHQYKNKDHLL